MQHGSGQMAHPLQATVHHPLQPPPQPQPQQPPPAQTHMQQPPAQSPHHPLQQQPHHPTHPSSTSTSSTPGTLSLPHAGPGVSLRASERVLMTTASVLAQQHYNEGNYAMCKRLLDSISISYRHEGWKSMLTTILLTALDCAVKLGAVHDAIVYTLELLGPSMLLTPMQRKLLVEQLSTLIHQKPMTPPNLPASTSDGALTSTNNSSGSGGSPFIPSDHLFDLDRRHELMHAHAHFVTLHGSSSSTPVSSSRDVSICVGDEFDCILSISMSWPEDTVWERMDVYFHHPSSTLPSASSGPQPSTTGSTTSTCPYHLVLMHGSGGPSVPIEFSSGGFDGPRAKNVRPTITMHGGDGTHNAAGSEEAEAQQQQQEPEPILYPDPHGVVRTDLTFPGVIAPLPTHRSTPSRSHPSQQQLPQPLNFTFGPTNSASQQHQSPQRLHSGNSSSNHGSHSLAAQQNQQHHLASQVSRTFRIRMRATHATTSSHAGLHLPNASGGVPTSAAASGSTLTPVSSNPSSALQLPGHGQSHQALLVSSIVAVVAIPPPPSLPHSDTVANTSAAPAPAPAGSCSRGSLKLKLDVQPTKHEDELLPLTEIERVENERMQEDKRRKRKGLPPLEEDVDLSSATLQPTYTHALRILPQHARARMYVLHPSPALVNEYTPIQIHVMSEGDEIFDGELSLYAAQPSTAAPAATANQTSSSPTSPPSSISTPTSTEESSKVDGGASAPSEGGGGRISFYRLRDPSSTSIVGPIGSCSTEQIFEELPPSASTGCAYLSLPKILPADGSHSFTVFMRSTQPISSTTISFTLSYHNNHNSSQSSNLAPLSITTLIPNFVFRHPFKIRSRVFSDALVTTTAAGGASGSGESATPNTTPSSSAQSIPPQPFRLMTDQPALMHVEIENVSGAPMCIEQLAFDLPPNFARLKHKNKQQQQPQPQPGADNGLSLQVPIERLRRCATPAAQVAIDESGQWTSSKLPPPQRQPPSSAIYLAAGEKYTHLLSLMPTTSGQTPSTPVWIRWTRILPVLKHSHAISASTSNTSINSVAVASSPSSVHHDKLRKNSSDGSSLMDIADFAPLLFPTPSTFYHKELPPFLITSAPVSVKLDHPPSCRIGDVVPLVVRLKNATDTIQELEVNVDGSGSGSGSGADGGGQQGAQHLGAGMSSTHTSSHTGHASAIKCVLSGETRAKLRLRPHSTMSLQYRLAPLECGAVPLPRLHIKALTSGTQPSATSTSTSTTSTASTPPTQSTTLLMDPNDMGYIFVHPREKRSNDSGTLSSSSQPTTTPATNL